VSQPAHETFGKKLRLRVCGLLFQNDKVLLINHHGLYGHDFWAPPGGGVDFGEPLQQALAREFMEECNLSVSSAGFLFAGEFVHPPLHAVELFFHVQATGQPILGRDPEVPDVPLLTELRFMAPAEIYALPLNHRHALFGLASEPAQLLEIRGFFPFA
jgi:8-oxo-dGTP diphosphatase